MAMKVTPRLLPATVWGVASPVMDDVTIGRRVAAARKRAGIDQRKTLTDAADLPRVGPATLGKIERGERHLFPHEADAFARVLGVDRGFFYEDDSADPASSHLGEIAGLIDRNADMLREAIAQAAEERRQIRDLLATQAEILREIRRVVAGMPEDETLRLWDQAVRQLAEAQERAEGDRDGGEEHAGPSAAQA